MIDTRANEAVQRLLDELVASGEERGLQAAAYQHGELVVDAWAGVADAASGQPVDERTLFTSFSVTKGVTSTCVHLLAERGRLEYDAPVAQYWPAFAARGKERVTVRHVLTHRSGVPQMPADVTPELVCDWDGICAAIADLPPLWAPGTRTGYHAYTFGWILGEVVRRIDGRAFGTFVRDEICRPLGIEDLYVGIPDEVAARVATLAQAPRPPGATAPEEGSLWAQAMPSRLGGMFNRPDVRRAALPAAGGIMSARAIARHYAALAGSVDGVRLLPPRRLAIATELQTAEPDAVLGDAVRKALGYWLGGQWSAMGERLTAFGHPGAGGAIAFADPEYGLAAGFTKNLLHGAAPPGQSTTYRVAQAIRNALGIP